MRTLRLDRHISRVEWVTVHVRCSHSSGGEGVDGRAAFVYFVGEWISMVFGGVAMMILSQVDATFDERRWVSARGNAAGMVALKRDDD